MHSICSLTEVKDCNNSFKYHVIPQVDQKILSFEGQGERKKEPK